MEITALREKLHSLIDSSSEDKLMEVYTIFEENYSDEFKSELNEEYAQYRKDGEVISREKVDETINKLLYGR